MPESIEHATYIRQHTHMALYFHTNLKKNCVEKLTKDFLYMGSISIALWLNCKDNFI